MARRVTNFVTNLSVELLLIKLEPKVILRNGLADQKNTVLLQFTNNQEDKIVTGEPQVKPVTYLSRGCFFMNSYLLCLPKVTAYPSKFSTGSCMTWKLVLKWHSSRPYIYS